MGKGDPTFAIVGVDWPHDPRYRRLKKPTYKLVCDHLWLQAHKFRKQKLDSYVDAAYMAHVCDIDARTVRKAFTRIVEEGLIEIDDNDCITILGVRKKNEKLGWKDKDIVPDTGVDIGRSNGLKREEIEKEIEESLFSFFELKARELADVYKTFKSEEITNGIKNARIWLDEKHANFNDMKKAIENYRDKVNDQDPTFTKRMDRFFITDGSYNWKDWLKSSLPEKPPVEVEADQVASANACDPEVLERAREAYQKAIDKKYGDCVDFSKNERPPALKTSQSESCKTEETG